MTSKKLNIRVTEDSVEIDGYVNAVERKSRLLNSRIGKFFEKIRAGVFTEALKNNKDVKLYLNHDPSFEYASTLDGSIELVEDSIGLHAHTVLTNADIVEKAKNGELVGWSFGFYDVEGGYELNYDTESPYPTRTVNALELIEVSLLDVNATPAYAGTLVTVRSEEGIAMSVGADMDEDAENVPENVPEEVPAENDSQETEEPEKAENEPESEPETDTEEQHAEEQTNSVDLSEYKRIIAMMKE